MADKVLAEGIPIDSIIVTDRTRKDFGDIKSLAESINTVGLMQPIVINESNELVDGQRRILAYEQLGKKEIPYYRIDLEQIVLGEFHANSNRKDFTSSERVAISSAVEKYLREYSRGVGRPRINKKADENFIKDSIPSHNYNATDSGISKNNVVKLATFSGRIKDNVSRYLGVTRNTLEKEKKIIEASGKRSEIIRKYTTKSRQEKNECRQGFQDHSEKDKKRSDFGCSKKLCIQSKN